MEKIKLSRTGIEELKTHANCELQLRESPFKDGSVLLFCLDHEEPILRLEE